MRTFFQSVNDFRTIYIQTHRVPDADAIASAYSLKVLFDNLGCRSEILFDDQERIKNNIRNLIDQYDIPTTSFPIGGEIQDEDLLLLVDAQYLAGNTTHVKARNVAVIDHHIDQSNHSYVFSNIQPRIGACCAMTFDYLRQAKITVTTELATIIYFGLYMDTGGFSGRLTNLDTEAKEHLESIVSFYDFNQLRLASLAFTDLAVIAEGLRNTERFGALAFAMFRDCDDSLLGHVADLLIEIDGVEIVVVYSEREDGYKLSVRSYHDHITAENIVVAITDGAGSGGGTTHKAGGFILNSRLTPPNDTISATLLIRTRAIDFTQALVFLRTGEDDPLRLLAERSFSSHVKRDYALRFFKVRNYFDDPIHIKTLEGMAAAEPEDFVVIGMKSEIWPMTAEYFSSHYSVVDDTSGGCLSDSHIDTYGIRLQSETKSVHITRESVHELGICSPVKGKPIRAIELTRPTKVRTRWGDFNGKVGDYLIYHDKSEYYVCDREIFLITYE